MKIFKQYFLFFFLILIGGNDFVRGAAVLQSSDSTHVEYEYYEEHPDSSITLKGTADSTAVQVRSFDRAIIDDLKSDAEMKYKQPPTIAESLWERLVRWFLEILEAVFSKATSTGWLRILLYVIGLGMVVILIMVILKVNAFRVLYSAQGARVNQGTIDENIHEMDFDDLIKQAIDKEDYRRGVRLLFLYALKILADKHLITWEAGKTNHEYVGELPANELKEGLNDLSYYFDYAWYGNFRITPDIFRKAQLIFNDWKQTVR
jgi:hypothetical protein